MNLIDRDELIKNRPESLNENMENKELNANHKGWNDCNKHWRKIIDEQPTVNEWIPISERLPEFDDTILVSDDCLVTDGLYPNVAYCTEEGHRWFSSLDDITELYNIIAWMPIPKYKEDKE